MSDPITQYYPQNPWQGVETKERTPWYYPTLYREFQRRTIFNRFVGMSFNHNGPRATELVISSLMMPHANHNPIGVRDMWLDASYMDTFARKITFRRQAAKMSLNRYDDLITYYELDGVRGLQRIINEGFGHILTRQMDRLARDAFLKLPFRLYGDGSGGFTGTNFANIDSSDTITTDLVQDINLGLKERDNPTVDTEQGLGNTVICITSPGVIRDLRNEARNVHNSNAFIDTMKYANPQSIITGEVGTYNGMRFLSHNDMILYNCGAIEHQATVDAPILAGDGAPNPESTAVDGVEYVGQAAATHFVTVNDASGFSVGDILTIHVRRTNAHGITNGVDWEDGKLHNRRVVAVDTGANTVTFDRPILEDFKVDLGGSVYGYVTKGRNVHTMLVLTGRDAVVTGVAQPPTIRMPRPIDDLDMIWRVTADYYMGWQPFNKHGGELVFLAGSNRYTGARYL